MYLFKHLKYSYILYSNSLKKSLVSKSAVFAFLNLGVSASLRGIYTDTTTRSTGALET